MGFCPGCGSDAALVEGAPGPRSAAGRAALVMPLAEAGRDEPRRRPTGLAEFDRVLGGGLVPGATVLVGGEPGVGKSTLLLQVAAGQSRPDLVVGDSIQTVAAAEVGGAPGGVAQVREAAARLVHFSKESGVPVALVGHVTKDGAIAGPRLLEHMVDVGLYLEGDGERGLRGLRRPKNRFGAPHPGGLFEMGDGGLKEVPDPSGWLVAGWRGGGPGKIGRASCRGRGGISGVAGSLKKR